MNPSQLRETVMDPTTRKLVQLTIDSKDNVNAMMDLFCQRKGQGIERHGSRKKEKLLGWTYE